MRLYQIPIPQNDNAGNAYPSAVREEFLVAVLRHCGGYTELLPCEGAWRDPQDGTVYYDTVTPLQFATDKPAALARVLHDFARLFPDQLCAMVTDLGAVTFHNLKEKELA